MSVNKSMLPPLSEIDDNQLKEELKMAWSSSWHTRYPFRDVFKECFKRFWREWLKEGIYYPVAIVIWIAGGILLDKLFALLLGPDRPEALIIILYLYWPLALFFFLGLAFLAYKKLKDRRSD